MEAANHLMMQQPRDNLFDVLRLIMMTCVDKNERLRAGLLCKEIRHSPISDVRVIKSWFERFVFNEQPLPRPERLVNRLQALLEKTDSCADILRTRIIRTVGKPRRNIAAIKRVSDHNAFQYVF